MLELDSNIGKIMDAIRAEAPETIVIITADNGAWQDAWPDAGTVPFRGEKGSPFEGGFRVPASCGNRARFRPARAMAK
jgi:arylsulfatase